MNKLLSGRRGLTVWTLSRFHIFVIVVFGFVVIVGVAFLVLEDDCLYLIEANQGQGLVAQLI